MKFATLFAALICILFNAQGFAGESPVRHFILKYQDQSFVVPKGEEWKLSWSSPWHAGEVLPAYDVRVEGGQAMIGERKDVQAGAWSGTPGENGLLDLSATNKPVVIWLSAGTKFETANEELKITVTVYKEQP